MKKSNIMKKVMMVICAVLVISSLALVGGVTAKYLRRHTAGDNAVSAARFYVESNYLTTLQTEDTPQKHYYLNAGTTSVTVELYNFLDELRVSEVAITYTITIESDDTSFSIDGYQKETSESSAKLTNTIEVQPLKQEDKLQPITTQIPLNLNNGHRYSVRVEANGGYKKTLAATFHVEEAADKSGCTVTKNDNFVVLTIWTGNTGGTVTFTVPEGLIPDETDPFLASSAANGTYAKKLEAYSSVSYRFFISVGYTAGSKFAVYLDGTQLTGHEVT